jgi:DNA relaxase NicK
VQARTASGPSSNTGRKARRESPPPALSQKGAFAVPAVPAFQDVAHVDYLSFTAPISAQHQSLSDYTDLCIEGQCYFIAALEKLFGIDRRAWKVGKGGFNGYRTKMATPAGAVIAWGGVAQRGTVHISLPGTVCAGAPGEGVDWHKVARFGELNAAKITRLDLAHDDFTGEEWNIEKLDALYAAGEFTSAGRPPARSFTESDTGRTLYFGKRQNGKMLRGYEKGRQMGDSQYPKWFRVEGEVRCKDRVIPWDALNRPGEFLAGLYPALKVLSVLQDKIATTRRIAALTVDQLKKVLQTQYGQFLNLLSFVHQGDGNCVLFEVSRPGFPKKFAGLAEFLDLLPPAALAAS